MTERQTWKQMRQERKAQEEALREELERRGITRQQYQIEQKAAKHPERYTRDADGSLRRKSNAEQAAARQQYDIEQAAARNPERFTTGTDGKLRAKTTDEVAAERRARREGRSPEEGLAQVQAQEALAPAEPARPPRIVARFAPLGVQIMSNGDVHTYNGFGQGRRLGPVAGAHAEMAAERKAHRVGGSVAATVALGPILGPLPLLGAVSKKSKASSFVVLANGTIHEKRHDGNAAVTSAQREVVRFNAAVVRYARVEP